MAIGIPGAATANLNNAAAHGFSEILYNLFERRRE